MADIEIEDDRGASLVPGAHRVVRTLDAKEGPFAGTLVTQGDGVVVRVDATVLRGWAGWRYAGAEHVAAPLDVSRRREGHDALLPWCTDRVLGFLVRRTAAGADVGPGECSTLVVSLLRGLDELGEGVDGVRTGVWWLTDGGRPVFVFGDGADARGGVVEIVGRLREHSADKALRRALGAVEEGLGKTLSQPRLPRKLTEAWEEELLSIAAPQPLERGSHAPERARDVARAVVSGDRASVPSRQRLRADRVRSGGGRRAIDEVGLLSGTILAVVGAGRGWFAGLRALLPPQPNSSTRVPGRRESPTKLRRRPLLIAGAAAAVVLAGGLLWPDGDATGKASGASERSSAESAAPVQDEGGPAVAAPMTDVPDAAERTGTAPDSSAREDPEVATVALLTTIADCRVRGDTACPGGVAADAEGIVEALGEADPETTTAELVDEYGDVAVIRLSASDSRIETEAHADVVAQMIVVLIRTDEKWLVRDVYDAADQPG